jgi:hypothetical protein
MSRLRQVAGSYLLYFNFNCIFIFCRFRFVICYRIFGRFVTRGVQKHDKKFPKKSIWAHHQKRGLFLSVFSPFFSGGRFARLFYRVFGRFVTRGVQKHDNKNRGKLSAAAKKKYLLT